MVDRPKAKLGLGLELEGQELKVVQLTYFKGRPTLSDIMSIKSDGVKLFYIKNQKKHLQALSSKSLVVTGLHASEVLTRSLTIHLTKEKDIDQVLDFQAEPLLPYPLEEAIVDRTILSKGEDSTQLTITATRKEQIKKHLEKWHEIQQEPETISCLPIALASFSKHFSEEETPLYVLHIGESETTSLLVENGSLLHAQAYQSGVHELRMAYSEDTGLTKQELDESFNSWDFEQTNEKTHPKLHQAINKLRIEITKQFFALAKHYPGQEINNVLLSGSGCNLPSLPSSINLSLNKDLKLPNPVKGFSLTEKELVKFSAPIGYALTALPKEKNRVNFRQHEYTFPYPWKRLKKPVAIYLGLCIALSAALFFFGNAYVQTKEDLLKKDYLKILTVMKKPFKEHEDELLKKNPFEKTFAKGETGDIKEMSQSNIRKRLQLLEKEIKETPDIFALYPNTPRVSDVLAWLSNHPLVKDTTDPNSPKHRILLENFSYRMVKRPEQNKKKERYQVKVEIDFSTPTPRYAREFHDALLAPNEIVDPKGDVKWNSERGRYRASFFLKDKTAYPNTKR